MKMFFTLLIVGASVFAATLEELTDYAIHHNTAVKEGRAQIELSDLKRKESRTQQYGELDFTGNFTHYNFARTLAPLTPATLGTGAPVTASKDIFYAGVAYSVPLFTGFAQTRQIEISDIAKRMSDIRLKLTKEQLVYNVRSLYLSILAQREMLEAQIAYKDALTALRKQIAYEVELGKKAAIDLLKAESNEQAARTEAEVLADNIEVTRAALSALVGKEVERVEPLDIELKKPLYSIERLYAEAKGLAKVKVEDMALRKADKAIQKSESGKLPQVNFSGFAGKNYGKDVQTDEWGNETLWQVGVNIKWNIFDFGKRDILVEQARVAKIEAAFKKEQTLLDLRKLLTQAVSKMEQSYARYMGDLSRLELTEKSEKIEEVRYRSNVSTLNDLLLAKSQTQLVRAKLIESRYNYQKSKYYLEYLLEKGVSE
ncbi:outer membrane efflux protein [Hydrogenimonas sp.]|nr:outer membrane efflux protein [Hydrogenimonas sp.]